MRTHINILFVLLLLISFPYITRAHFHILVPRDGYAIDTTIHHRLKDTTAHHNIMKKRVDFHYAAKQFFFEGQAYGGFLGYGFQFVAGYKLGRFGILGGGIGMAGQSGFLLSIANTDPYNGYYFPVFAHYQGDILKEWVTPYYDIEAGYSFRYTNSSYNNYITVIPFTPTITHPVYKYNGGFIGVFDFGVKVYTRHRAYVTVGGTFNVQQAGDKYSNYFSNSIGQDIKVSYNSSAFFFVPALKVGCGF
jgi:hypothetical protein